MKDNTLDDQSFDLIIMYFTNIATNTSDPLTCCNNVKATFPLVMEELFGPPQGELLSFWLGVQLWNIFPHPDNNFQPIKIELPKRNQSCLCGSGKRFKQCCINVPMIDSFSSEMFWPYLVDMLSHKDLVEAAKQRQLPVDGLRIVAEIYLNNDEPKKAIALLEPSFADEGKHLSKQHSGLTDLLCDAYNEHYQTDKKKVKLLEQLKHHPVKRIRCEAWQRIASVNAEKGNHKQAIEALYEAMKADPKDLSNAILEIKLLVSSNNIEMAKQRANFWYTKIVKFPDVFKKLGDFLETAKTDPVEALSQMQIDRFNDPQLEVLQHWFDTNHQSIPLPDYQLDSMGVDEESIENFILKSPKSCSKTFEMWQDDFSPCDKPFSTQWINEVDTWFDPYDTDWIEFLEKHPDSVHNIDLLDDVINCLMAHPGNELPVSPAKQLAKKIADHVLNILLPLSTEILENSTQRFSWLILDNRPALRILANRILLTEDNSPEAFTLINTYIKLNPTDNHGFRSLLMNQMIRQREYKPAKELASQYPDDCLVDMMMGKALADFAEGDKVAAGENLRSSLQYHPFLIPYLTRTRVAKPTFSEFGIAMGGKDEAWIYREEMRDVWLQMPGALEWLKEQHKLIDYKK